MPNFARLLSIDYSSVFGEDHVKMTSFASDTSMFDFDIVIWDPERSLELFGITCEVREKPNRAEHWRKALLNTVGRMSGVPEWYVYLDDAAVEDAEKTDDESAGDTADE